MEFNAAKEPAWFPESKIYFNGSQHIAIPHTTRRYKKRPKKVEKIFVVPQDDNNTTMDGAVIPASVLPKFELLDDDECPDCPLRTKLKRIMRRKVSKIHISTQTWCLLRLKKSENPSLSE